MLASTNLSVAIKYADAIRSLDCPAAARDKKSVNLFVNDLLLISNERLETPEDQEDGGVLTIIFLYLALHCTTQPGLTDPNVPASQPDSESVLVPAIISISANSLTGRTDLRLPVEDKEGFYVLDLV